MDVNELYEIIAKLVNDGKGDYLVNIKGEDTWEIRSYGVDIEDERKEIVIKGI
jgi:hypothetical protein